MIERIIVFVLFFYWWWYWKKEEIVADKAKPKTKTTFSLTDYASKYLFRGILMITMFQVLGLPLLPFPQYSLRAAVVGVLLVSCGVWICIVARRELSANWANGYEYQIKKYHELITSGIYKHIRHPIYTGIALLVIGSQLVAQSYLWISCLGLFFAFYFQGRREEKLLLSYFGAKYKKYVKTSKMFVPFLF